VHRFKKVLVTGGAGCIGIQVCRELVDRGITVVLFDLYEQISRVHEHLPTNVELYCGSILDSSSLRDALDGSDSVIHLAGYLGVRRTEINALRCLEINIAGTKNVLDCGVQNGIEKIVFASSSEVYGEPLENPVSENSITQGKTVYAVTKLAGEELCKAYVQRYPQLSCTILRYFNTYGAHQIAQFVIPKFIRNVTEGKPPIIYGDGQQKRCFCHASDTAWATVEALFSDKVDGETLNIGNSESLVTVSELAKMIIRICGKEGSIHPKYQKQFGKTDRSKDREVYERYCDTSQAERLLQFSAKVGLEEGIQRVIDSGLLDPKWLTTDMYYALDESPL